MAKIISTRKAPENGDILGSNDIRAPDFPAIESGNDSFPNGDYLIDSHFGSAENEFVLVHRVENASLIQQMLNGGSAQYACAVAAPKSAFREVRISPGPEQTLLLDPSSYGEPPYLTPMIICTKETKHLLSCENDGVHPDWDGQTVVFPRGARLTQGPVLNFADANVFSLMKIKSAPEQHPGQFSTEEIADTTFRFIVECHPDLHVFLKSKKSGHEASKQKDILTHMVTSCFNILQKRYSQDDDEGGWKAKYKSLEKLSEALLESIGQDWTDEDFRPEEAATFMHPHDLPAFGDSDE